MKISPPSFLLVGLQMLLIILVFITGPWFPRHSLFFLPFIAGWLIALAAFFAFRQSKFTVFPEPRKHATLITNGVYRWIRHPFYTAVLFVTGALVADTFTIPRLVAMALLLVVFVVKINHEEKLLSERFPDYEAYRKTTNKLFPWIW